MKMKTTAAVLATVALACAVRSQAAGLDLGGGRLKGRPPQTLIACGGGSVWLLAPDGRVTWRKDGCGNIHRAVRRGDKVYWSNGNVWVTDIPSRKTELFYSPAKSNGTYGFWITDAGTMVVSENATDYITELKLGSKEVVTRFKGDPRGIDGKMPGAHHHYRMVQKTAAGTYLVCCSGANVVREYDAAGKLVWEQPTPALAFEASRRANGNTLVSHLGAITEYTPDHRAVWSFKCSDAPELKLANLCGIHERANGNLVVGTYANGVEDGSRTTAFEVTRDGKVVWSYAPAGRRLSTMTVLPAEESAATDRMAASYHSYEFADVAWTPPPEGFRPFYVSHYGRHGSRRINALGGLHGDWLLKLLQDAEKDGNLTPLGRELLADIARFDKASAGFQGELTQRGVDEHRTLARRMAARTPEVFAPGRRVECCATRSPRCLLSMANFTLALSTVAPGLDISYATGEKIHKMLTGLAFADQKAVKRRKAFGNRLYARSVDSARLLKSLFADPSKVKSGDTPYEFMQKLYVCASDCQCLVREIGELDLWRYFTKDELAALFRCVSAMEYVVLGNSKEFRGEAAREAASAVRDIVERADRAIADPSVAADLRFGHDSGIWPVAGLLDLVGPGDSCPMEEAWEKCPSWKYMSMASNLQMVFFRNAGGKVLVKILWNERETLVRGPKPVSGPYYDWDDIKFHIAKATGERTADAPPDVCVPSPAHLAYQGREIMALVCWGLNPYTNQEWGFGNVPTSKITAKRLDPAQWVRAMKAAEIRSAVLVAKHHDGFCLWPSKYNKGYSMADVPAPNTGRDLVREMSDACRREGLKFGVYLSPWDRNRADYATPAYIDYFFAQWNELLDNYGEICEIWLDGANGGTGWYGGANGGKGERRAIPRGYYQKPRLLALLHEKHPLSVAFGGDGDWSSRWCGNESGWSPETWWCPRKGEDGREHWTPSEADFPLRRGWYWHANERPKSLDRLVKAYFETVGRGAVMDIGIAPDTEGRVCEADERRLAEFGAWVRAFNATNVADGAKVSERRDGNRLVVEIALPAPAPFDCADFKEDIARGQRVKAFRVDVHDGNAWREMAKGTTVGYRRLARFPAVTSDRVRITLDGIAPPQMLAPALRMSPRVAGKDDLKASDTYMKTWWKVVDESCSAPRNASCAIDGDYASLWHSHGKSTGPLPPPQSFTVDCGTELLMHGFDYTPRMDGCRHGMVDAYAFHVSADGKTWSLAGEGEFGNLAANPVKQRVSFAKPVKARYFRFTATRALAGPGSDRVAVAEIDVW